MTVYKIGHKEISIDTCLKNLMLELFEVSQNLFGYSRIEFNTRKDKFNAEFTDAAFNVSLIKDQLTVKVKTRLRNNIPDALMLFERAVEKDKKQYKDGLDLETINGSIKTITDTINEGERIPLTNVYTFFPDSIEQDLGTLPKNMKRVFFDYLFPKFAEYLDTDVGVEQIAGLEKYKKMQDSFSSAGDRLKEQRETGSAVV